MPKKGKSKNTPGDSGPAEEHDGIYAEHLQGIGKVLSVLSTAVSEVEGSYVDGDQGLSFAGGEIEVQCGEVQSGQVSDQSPLLLGWIRQIETEYWFVPCVPQLHWSPKKQKWVPLADIIADNRRRARKRKKSSSTGATKKKA